jgi:alkaline phosphatase D
MRGLPPLPDLNRRHLLTASAGLLGLALPGCSTTAPVRSAAATGALAYPFSLGVASGEPNADGFVIWTRLAPDPLQANGGMPPTAVAVEWQVAEDERFSRIVRQGTASAEPGWAHSVHVEVQGLSPDRWYWYRFIVPKVESPVGRARTLPVAGADVQRWRIAVASCQNYEQGHYAAYRQMAEDAPDLVLFLGDYIYESYKGGPVRQHAGGAEARSLADYRVRHAQYKLDPLLQGAHAACPWFMVWDDHEVQNDYCDVWAVDASPAEKFVWRRAAAYQAYYEHMPLRARARPQDGRVTLYTDASIGRLASLHLLDARQYRDDQACPAAGQFGARLLEDSWCPQRSAKERTMLGAGQERWLADGFRKNAAAQWTVIGQQVLMVPLDQKPGPGAAWWSDGWDGYPAARQRLLEALVMANCANPVVLSGDAHSYWASELSLSARPVATEFLGTSLSSSGLPYERFAAFLPDNPQVKYFESRLRGYMRCELTPQRWTTDLMGVADIADPASPVRRFKSLVVEAGRPAIQAAS